MPSSISTKTPKSVMLRTAALDDRARRVLLRERGERVRLELLQAEADALLARVDLEHDRLDGVADRDDLRRVLDPPGPASSR